MVFRHNVDMTPLEEGQLVAQCWEAAGMEGDKALGSPECPLGNSKAVSCKVFTIKRTESAEDRAGSPRHSSFSESREQPLLEGWHEDTQGGSVSCSVSVGHRSGMFLCPHHSLQEGTGHSALGWELSSACTRTRTVPTWAGHPC